MPEDFGGPEDLNQPPSFFPQEGRDERSSTDFGPLVEVQIDGVYQSDQNGQISRFVILKEGERRLPILIGAFEAHAIQAQLEGIHPDRPMTHDLLRNILDRFEAPVLRAVIDDLWSTIFYAKLFLEQGSGEIEIDCRPSDAIAMAARFGAPIFVRDGILDQEIEF